MGGMSFQQNTHDEGEDKRGDVEFVQWPVVDWAGDWWKARKFYGGEIFIELQGGRAVKGSSERKCH